MWKVLAVSIMVGTAQDSGVETECDGESNDSSVSRLVYSLIRVYISLNDMFSLSYGKILQYFSIFKKNV